jgi:glycosyltransferase involved in cell wall biosynthesis
MRVLALTSLYPTPFHPHRATFNRQQFRALADEHEVRVIAPIAWTGEWSARRRVQRGTASPMPPERRRVFDGIVVDHPRFAFTPRILRGRHGGFMAQSVGECFREAVARFRPEVVLGCWAYPDGWAAVRLAREAGLPVAIKVHGSDLLTIQSQRARRRRTIEALAEADAIIAVSRGLADQAIVYGAAPSRVHVVHNGVDDGIFYPGPRDAARARLGLTGSVPLILFIGNLVGVKAPDVLIEALGVLARAGCRFECALIGDGPLRGPLRSRIHSLGLGASVRLVGPRAQDELPWWYRSADLLVVPSRSEGIPNVLLEAEACGTAFVASHVGGIPEIAPPEALVPPGDSQALAERIARFLDPRTRPTTGLTRRPSNWLDSARALAGVLRGIVASAASEASRAA